MLRLENEIDFLVHIFSRQLSAYVELFFLSPFLGFGLFLQTRLFGNLYPYIFRPYLVLLLIDRKQSCFFNNYEQNKNSIWVEMKYMVQL